MEPKRPLLVWDALAVAFALGILLWLVLPPLRLVAADGDASAFAGAAYGLLHPFRLHDTHFGLQYVDLFGMSFPVLRGGYEGAAHAYTMLPFVALWPPPSLFATQAYVVFFAALLIAACYWLALLLFEDRLCAFFAALLTATLHSYVARNMLYKGAGLSVPALATVGVCLLVIWLRDRRLGLGWAGLFCLGWAFASHTWIGALFVGLVLYAAFDRKRLAGALPAERRRRIHALALGLAAFAAPIIPALIGGTLLLRGNLGLPNELHAHLPQILDWPRLYWAGTREAWIQLDLGYPVALPWTLWGLAAGLIALGHAFRSEASSAAGRLLFFAAFGSAAALPLSPTEINPSHWQAAFPFVVVALAGLPALGAGRAWRAGAAVLLLGAVAGNAIACAQDMARVRDRLAITGAAPPAVRLPESFVAEGLCRWLARLPPGRPLIVASPELSNFLAYCSGGRLQAIGGSAFRSSTSENALLVGKWLALPGAYFVCPEPLSGRSPDGSDIDPWDSTCGELRALAKRPARTVASFARPDGSPGFRIYQFIPFGNARSR